MISKTAALCRTTRRTGLGKKPNQNFFSSLFTQRKGISILIKQKKNLGAVSPTFNIKTSLCMFVLSLTEDTVMADHKGGLSMAWFNNLINHILDMSIAFSFDKSGFIRHQAAFSAHDLDIDCSGKRHLITGANSGLGKATALAIARPRRRRCTSVSKHRQSTTSPRGDYRPDGKSKYPSFRSI